MFFFFWVRFGVSLFQKLKDTKFTYTHDTPLKSTSHPKDIKTMRTNFHGCVARLVPIFIIAPRIHHPPLLTRPHNAFDGLKQLAVEARRRHRAPRSPGAVVGREQRAPLSAALREAPRHVEGGAVLGDDVPLLVQGERDGAVRLHRRDLVHQNQRFRHAPVRLRLRARAPEPAPRNGIGDDVIVVLLHSFFAFVWWL